MITSNRYFYESDFFFFQAEDGIRDYKVTGVQTCALPISLNAAICAAVGFRLFSVLRQFARVDSAGPPPVGAAHGSSPYAISPRFCELRNSLTVGVRIALWYEPRKRMSWTGANCRSTLYVLTPPLTE